jgi:hypothetical protein
MFWVIGLNMQFLFVNDDKGILSVEQKPSNLKYRTGNTGYLRRFGMAQKRYCQYCGAEISPMTRYCPSCGAAQQAPTQPQQQPYVAPQPQPQSQPQPYYQPPAQTYQPPPAPVATNKSTGNILAAVSIILGIVGLFVAGIILGIVAIIVGAAAISKKSRAGGAVGIILGIIAFVAALLLILGVITI